jgi:hypothetical protein
MTDLSCSLVLKELQKEFRKAEAEHIYEDEEDGRLYIRELIGGKEVMPNTQ